MVSLGRKYIYIYMNDCFSFAGAIDFKEFVCGISAACRGPQFERYKCESFVLAWLL